MAFIQTYHVQCSKCGYSTIVHARNKEAAPTNFASFHDVENRRTRMSCLAQKKDFKVEEVRSSTEQAH